MTTMLAAILILPPAMARKKTAAPDSGGAGVIDTLLKQPDPAPPAPSPGSLFVPGSRLGDLARDLRATQLHDQVTIIVNEATSAVSSGVTNTSRKSSVVAGVSALGGQLKAASALTNLANSNANQQLQGQATTSRDSTLTTSLSAEVRYVFPNGNLLIVGRKELYVNGEHQTVTVRGIIRTDDITPANTVTSAQVAGMEILVNGKGVVSDAVKRPFILYRLLLGLLPF